MCDLSSVVPWLSSAVSLISVFFTAAVWWVSREKLRLDLYNRRFKVYSRTLDLFHILETWSPTTLEAASTSLQDSPELSSAQRAFTKASRESQFLFPDDSGIHRLLVQVHTDMIAVIGYKRDRGPKLASQPEALTPAYYEFLECYKRIRDSIQPLEQKLSKYLNFHALSAWGELDSRG